MAGGKASPRQQMINMMYLVLTALLAMNVSKEILNSFVTIDKGQNETRASFEGKLSAQMANFARLAEEKPEKYGDSYKIAKSIQDDADNLISYVNRIKAMTIAETEGKTMEEVYDAKMDTVLGIAYINSKDNYDSNTNIMFGTGEEPDTETRSGDDENFRAAELRKRLEAYRDKINSQINDPSLQASMTRIFNYESTVDADGKPEPWERLNFYHVPLAATISILSKLQSDVRSAQSDAIGKVYADVEGASLKFTKLKDAVIPISTDVTAGGSFEADVFLAAYDDTNPPEIRLGKPGVRVDTTKVPIDLTGDFDVLEMDKNAMGKVKIPAGGLGPQHREGVIIFRPAGLPEVRKKFALDYNVVAPTLVVSPTKMNVFYKGVDNPVTVGVPGFQDRDVVPSISNGSISKGSDGYVVKVTSGNEANISVTCTLPDGSKKTLGPAKFRVKSVPDPVAMYGGKGSSDETIKFSELIASQGVAAVMKDFDFDLKFTVTKFEVSMSIGGQFISKSSSSNRVTPEISEMLKNAKNGQKVFIEGIRAQGPDGTVRSLGSLAFKVVK
ncbi:MAG: gliding motility protein GldM [Bacteroidetes bacterium]|nr:gliding motility protein GldM [Bacteroidota bacterium]